MFIEEVSSCSIMIFNDLVMKKMINSLIFLKNLYKLINLLLILFNVKIKV